MTSRTNIANSIAHFHRAQQYMPGGVNSPVRAFKSVGGTPLFMERSEGAYIYDADGNDYVDFINSWGPMILGHGHPKVVEAIQEQAARAISFGAPTALETEMAAQICAMCPNVDLVRLVSSGTEACMTALRLARGYTGKNKLIKFNGCYHGHADPFLIKAGSGVATFGIQHVPGITQGVADDTLILEFNDIAPVAEMMENSGDEVAAIIVEPVAGNMGCIPPQPGFLEGLRSLCDRYGAVLIFDEVMTGFRLTTGGVQQLLGVDADLITYGKVVGGGMPVGAVGGKREIMETIAPVGKVYQAGTLSGHPVAMRAGITTLRILAENPEIYTHNEKSATILAKELLLIFEEKGLAHTVNQIGSMLSVHFSSEPVIDFPSAAAGDSEMFNRYFHHMLLAGVYLPPSMFESWFMSRSIGDTELNRTLEATRNFLT